MHDLPQAPPKHFQQLAKKTASPFASIIKFPPPNTKKDAYKDLVCTDQDRMNIHELITILAENGKLSLLVKQSYVKNLGAQVNHVHPLKFLGVIFSNPALKMAMTDIFDDYFKRSGFMDGLGGSLSREADKGQLDPFLEDFAAEVKVPVGELRKFIQSRDWENLVRFLMQP
jgi:hypothetical protein